jgi:hypothetical protein
LYKKDFVIFVVLVSFVVTRRDTGTETDMTVFHETLENHETHETLLVQKGFRDFRGSRVFRGDPS